MAQKKKITQKVRKIIEGDVRKSIAVASLLLNVLFLVSIFVLTATSTFDRRLYTASRNQYCKNTGSINNRIEQLGSEDAAVQEREVDCVGPNFQRYYQEAIDKYRAEANER